LLDIKKSLFDGTFWHLFMNFETVSKVKVTCVRCGDGRFTAYHANPHLVRALADEGGQLVGEVARKLGAALSVLHSAATEAGQVVGLLGGGVRFVLAARQQLTCN
jgi:ribosomal protein S27AE